MLKTVKMWSDDAGAEVEWTIALEKEDNGTAVIVARYGEELHKFSPSTTDAELENLAANIQHGVSGVSQELLNG